MPNAPGLAGGLRSLPAGERLRSRPNPAGTPTGAEAGRAGCACCGHHLDELYEITRFRRPLLIARCGSCGFQAQLNAPAAPNEYYDEAYYSGRAEYAYRDERALAAYDRHVHRARLATISRYVRPPADFLDIGCAFGGLVRAAQELGFRARGLDVSEYAVNEGRRSGLDLERGDLSSGTVAPNSADVVTLIEVIEHLADPESAFAALGSIVRPGGLLVIQTANFEGLQAKRAGRDYHYYLPGHLHYFSTRTLRIFLERHGFSRVRFFRPVDFGLLPKLLKARGQFRSPSDYAQWLRIAWYHLKGRVAWGHFALTSSMVAYAIRDE